MLFGDLRYLQKPGELPLNWTSVLFDWILNLGEYIVPFPADFVAYDGLSLMSFNMFFIWIYDLLLGPWW